MFLPIQVKKIATLTSLSWHFSCNPVETSPGATQETFMLCEATSCLITSETTSWKNFVPEYTAKPANPCSK